MDLALKITNLTKTYDTLTAVQNVSLQIPKGEIFGLLGPNGAGKTSIISIITTLEKPTSGSVEVFGINVQSDPNATKRLVGVVHQEVVNSGFFDVNEILKFISGYYGLRKNKDRIDYVLNKLGLWEHRFKKVKQLSGGMKRRLMVAKALVHYPKLLLLDEPTAGVDISLREDLWTFVQELHKEGTTVLLTTHYLEEAQNLCHRVGIIDKGQLRCEGLTSEIISQFTTQMVHIKLEPHACERVKNKSSKIIMNRAGIWNASNELVLNIKPEESIGSLLVQLELSSSEILNVQRVIGSLEDAFKKVLSKTAE